MFHDQKEYLHLSQIFADIICLAVLYYLIVPLFLSTANGYFTLPISIMPHPMATIHPLRTARFFLLSPFFIVTPLLLSMTALNGLYEKVGRPNILSSFVVGEPGPKSRSARGGYKKTGLPDTKNVYYKVIPLSILSSVVLSILFFSFGMTLKETVFFSIISFCILFLTLTLNRLCFFYCLKRCNSSPNLIRHFLLVGTGPRARQVAAYVENHPQCGWRITGFLTDQPDDIGKTVANKKILGEVDQLPRIVHEHYTDCVVYPGDDSYTEHHDFLLKSCAGMGIDFATTKENPMNMITTKAHVFSEHIGNIEFKLIKFVYRRPLVAFFKRMFDLTASSIIIVLCLPFWVTIPISIKITSPGPVFFKQERIGKYGKKFILFKFRSMVGGAEKMQESLMHLNEMDGPAFKIKNDPRQTRTGKFLRKTSLDELPQLFNVFRGDISMVGPRPAIEKEVLQYRPIERKRLSVTQGITCIWQVSGRNNIKFDEWMKLDLMYIDNLSTAQDFRILLKTIPAVLLKNGAY